MREEVDKELGITDEAAGDDFFSSLSDYTERFKKKHGDVDL